MMELARAVGSVVKYSFLVLEFDALCRCCAYMYKIDLCLKVSCIRCNVYVRRVFFNDGTTRD